ncbi:MAG: molybdopterin-guanine dinucleotide biosynthesis protein B [Clostridiales bacterium]|nr:molybdopterin-guanine dinucleotide biosynthesis protein B [Clostridiales bacterium]
MKVFCVCGVSGSGKTTTIEKIIEELKKRGNSVGSIKDIHAQKFSFDTPGKNTWRHREAGAEMVAARGMAETALMIPKRVEIPELLKWFSHDFVVIEGGRDEGFPKILTASSVQEINERLDESVFAVSGVVAGQGISLDGTPVINALTDAEKLVDLIELSVREHCGADWHEERLASKKNRVFKRQRIINGQKRFVVEKEISDPRRFRIEFLMYNALRHSGIRIPRLFDIELGKGMLVFEYIDGEVALDALSDRHHAELALSQIAMWMADFYETTYEEFDEQWILGDIHLRNFIYNKDSQTVTGFDFEDAKVGAIEQDVARMFLFIATYEPEYSTSHMELAEYFLSESLAMLNLDKGRLLEELHNEAEHMAVRRNCTIDVERIVPAAERVFKRAFK